MRISLILNFYVLYYLTYTKQNIPLSPQNSSSSLRLGCRKCTCINIFSAINEGVILALGTVVELKNCPTKTIFSHATYNFGRLNRTAI